MDKRLIKCYRKPFLSSFPMISEVDARQKHSSELFNAISNLLIDQDLIFLNGKEGGFNSKVESDTKCDNKLYDLLRIMWHVNLLKSRDLSSKNKD